MSGSHIRHSGGLNRLVVELGFDTVKFFEGTITTTPTTITISPPARRLILRNTSSNRAVWFNVTGDTAQAVSGLTPGDNIKVGAGCTFNMDFDILSSISIVTGTGSAPVEGTLGWKGTK